MTGYTLGMKRAVFVPDDIFAEAERLARRMKKSRSELFRDALAEYITRHAHDRVTETMNQVCAEIGGDDDPLSRLLRGTSWGGQSGDLSQRYLMGQLAKPQ